MRALSTPPPPPLRRSSFHTVSFQRKEFILLVCCCVLLATVAASFSNHPFFWGNGRSCHHCHHDDGMRKHHRPQQQFRQILFAKKGEVASAATTTTNDNNNKDEEMDFSWMDNLKQWPRLPSDDEQGQPVTNPTSTSNEASSTTTSTATSTKSSSSSSSSSSKTEALRLFGNSPLGSLLTFENDVGDNKTDVFSLADQLFQAFKNDEDNPNSSSSSTTSSAATNTTTTMGDFFDKKEKQNWFDSLTLPGDEEIMKVSSATTRLSVTTSTSPQQQPPRTSNQKITHAAEVILKDATSRIDQLVGEASTALQPKKLQELIAQASQLVFNEDIIQEILKDKGSEQREYFESTSAYANKLVSVGKNVLGAGYARGGATTSLQSSMAATMTTSNTLETEEQEEPLFASFDSARLMEAEHYDRVVMKGAEMSILAGSIYEDNDHERLCQVGHSLVANGTTADVAWRITDSVDHDANYQHGHGKDVFLTRTLTLRGFDASDDGVDRERLLNVICTATPEAMGDTGVLLHSGLLQAAKEIYETIRPTLMLHTAPQHKLAITGHSIGGSLSILILLLMTQEFGADYVVERVARVFTFGSPPIASSSSSRGVVQPLSTSSTKKKNNPQYPCPVLEAFGLPADIVYGYVQPYDPIVRFLSECDPLYPLVDDLGADAVTLYASGPMRSLRPVARALFSSWEGWPAFRECWKGTTDQTYHSMGVQHILLPDPFRYLNDRFVSPNVGVPSTEAIVRISSAELLPALKDTFPLDVFQISLVPQAVRSFLHHFYPAYDVTIASYAEDLKKESLVDKGSVKQSN